MASHSATRVILFQDAQEENPVKKEHIDWKCSFNELKNEENSGFQRFLSYHSPKDFIEQKFDDFKTFIKT